jgi:diguanylate cyclase (GGDEF)-like protein
MSRMLPFHAGADAVAALEAAWASPEGKASPGVAVELAWHLRQRDAPRAAALAEQAQALLAAEPGPSSAARRACHARLQLIRGEGQWLDARLSAAAELANAALADFNALDDPIGRADAHWLLAMLAIDRGDWRAKDAELDAMVAVLGGVDSGRSQAAMAAQAYFAVFRDRDRAQARWGTTLAAGHLGLEPAAGAWAEDFLAVCAHHRSDFVLAIRHFVQAYTLALATGQLRRAIVAATNAGDALNHLNDYQGALEWMQRGLDLARRTGWPGSMGVALLQTAHSLRLLNRLQASRELLREALAFMAPLAGSRNHAYALWHLSEVELACGDHAAALASCQALAASADTLQQADLQSSARCGQARALLGLGRPLEALEAAMRALHHGQAAANLQIAALRVLAELHAAHTLPAPAALRAPSVALHYLDLALELAAGIERLTVPAELLEAAACEQARLGDYRAAYHLSQRASESRKTTYNQEASNRAIAMQVTHETDRARAEADHQRGLAQAQAERLATLERLGAAGQEITGTLEPAAIFAALDHHGRALLDANALVIYRLAADGAALDMAFGEHAGEPLAPHRVDIQDPTRLAARCAREAREIIACTPAGAEAPAAVGPWASMMCVPLQVGGRLVGVMSIQSAAADTYTERESAIFRTLCAYGSIALANADVQALLVLKNRQLEVLSVSDRLTGLYNRLRLDEVLQEERARHERSGAELSVVLIDLDDFKSVNDTHGHPVGDTVLVSVATLLKSAARQLDVVGRWGGEEFLVICRDTDLAGAAVLAEKLRSRLARHPLPPPLLRNGTASFGVACLREGEEIGHLLARADVALYRAKRSGRNRVEVESTSMPPAPAAALETHEP